MIKPHRLGLPPAFRHRVRARRRRRTPVQPIGAVAVAHKRLRALLVREPGDGHRLLLGAEGEMKLLRQIDVGDD